MPSSNPTSSARLFHPALLLVVLPVSGCFQSGIPDAWVGNSAADALAGAEPRLLSPAPVEEADLVRGEAKSEWGPRDRPDLFSDDLEYDLDALPLESSLEQSPWAGNYWPVYKDSVNHRWAGLGSKSAAEKYGEAFDVPGIEDEVSRYYGIDRQRMGNSCTSNDECDSDLGEVCATRRDAEDGACIPTWWGICHAWAPAAIMEPEPIHPVTRNGVTFEVNDIKALVTLGWDRTNTRFASLRCNGNESADEIEYDLYDRPTIPDLECADTNPGTYHVLLANYLGLRGQSFVEDRTFDMEVWNQPLRGYRVTQMDEITAEKANELVGVPNLGEATSTFSGIVQTEEWLHEGPISGAPGTPVEVRMQGTGDADLYARFGSLPNLSTFHCRPYANGSEESCSLTFPLTGQPLYLSVRGYAGPAEFEVVTTVQQPATGPSESVVVAEFDSGLSQDEWYHHPVIDVDGGPVEITMTGSADSDLYARWGERATPGAYDCRPFLGGSDEGCQLDAPGSGGRLYLSVHAYSGTPDFEVSVTAQALPGSIPDTYVFNDDAAKLYDVSLEVDFITESPAYLGGNLEPRIDDFTRTDQYRYVLELDALGQVVGGEWIGRSKRNHPDFLWLPISRGEHVPIAGGAINYTQIQDLLDASVQDEDPQELEVVTVHEAGSLAKAEWRHFGPFTAQTGSFDATITGTGDADLYVRQDQAPTISDYDCRPYRSTSMETCGLEGPGVFFVAVRGYGAESSFELNVSYVVGGGSETDGGSAGDGSTADADSESGAEGGVPVVHLDLAEEVAQGEMDLFTVPVETGRRIVVRTVAPADVDLYLGMATAPTTSSYDMRGYTASGNETLEFTPVANGLLHIGVHGYRASTYVLTTADE